MSELGYNGPMLYLLLRGTRVAAVKVKRVAHVATPIDESDGEDNGFRFIRPEADTFGIELSVDGVATIDNYGVLLDEFYGTETLADFVIQHADGTLELTDAFMTSLEFGGESAGYVSFSAAFSSSGESVFQSPIEDILLVGELAGRAIDLTWTEAPSAEQYQLYRSVDGGGYTLLATIDAADPRTYTDTGLSADTIYRYLVQGVAGSSSGPTSNIVQASIGEGILIAVNLSGTTGQELARSDDGGETWAFLAGPNSAFLLERGCFDTSRERVFVGSDTFGTANNGWYSDDYGDSWQQCTKVSLTGLGQPIYNPDADEVWALGNSGGDLIVSRSVDGGANWSSVDPGFVSGNAEQGSTLVPGGSMYCVSSDSRAPRTPDGVSASFVGPVANMASRDILYVEDFGLWLGTRDADIVSSADGETYTLRVTAGITAGQPKLAYSPRLGIAVCLSNSDQLNSVDGINWTAPGSPPTLQTRRLIFSRAWDRYVAVGTGSANAYTSDDAENWDAHALPSSASWSDVIECDASELSDLGPWPTPVVVSISPDTVQQNSTETVTVTGDLFAPSAVVRVDGVDQATTWVSITELRFSYSPADAGTFAVDVVQGVAQSNSVPVVVTPFDPTFATLDTAPAGITLSNGDLTATRAAGGSWLSVLSTIGKSSGKWYWEATIDAAAGTPRHGIGVGPSSLPSNNYPGQTATSYGYFMHAFKINNATAVAFGATVGVGDVISVALDVDAGKIWWAKNGVWQGGGDPAAGTGEAYSGLSGTIFAASGLFPTGSLTYNFGQGSFTYAPPAGFNAGLYDL